MSFSVAERRAALLARQAEREAKQDEARLAHEVEGLELVDRLEESLGARGSAFEVIDCGADGFIAVALNDFAPVTYKKFQSVPADKLSPEHVDALVAPAVVHPSVERYRELVGRRPALANRCAHALLNLMAGKSRETQGEY